MNLTNEMLDYPLYFIYSIEYFRHELFKAQYLFLTLTSSNSLDFNSIEKDKQHLEDIQQIEKFTFCLINS